MEGSEATGTPASIAAIVQPATVEKMRRRMKQEGARFMMKFSRVYQPQDSIHFVAWGLRSCREMYC